MGFKNFGVQRAVEGSSTVYLLISIATLKAVQALLSLARILNNKVNTGTGKYINFSFIYFNECY